MALTKRRMLVAGGVITLFAVIGAVVAIVVWQSSGSSEKTTTSTAEGGKTDSGGSSQATKAPRPSTGSFTGSGVDESGSVGGTTPTSDPTKEKYTLSAYAIGDWGTTVGRDSCCKRRADHTPTNIDKNAEDVVAAVMGKAAETADPKPKAILGHGDSFYWVGIIDKTDQAYRFEQTFENKFKAKSLDGIPWINVMGNHDYGGASYICAKGGAYVPCNSKDELVQALKDKFTLQAEYKSPNSNRWIMKDHFYVHQLSDDASGVSIDVFNLDINDADVHGGEQICCQCYGYSNGGSSCSAVTRGHKFCAGGNNDMFDACMDQLKEWSEQSRQELVKAVKASTATWKIVNAHYSPYNHYAESRQKMWWDLLKGLGVQLWINGHTHGEKHDHASINVHFIENGAGGGILNEAASGIPPYTEGLVEKIWSYGVHDYGFFELAASKEWLRASFLTFDDKWNVEDDFTKSTIGGVATKHCWYIPVDGSKGKSCGTNTMHHHRHHKKHHSTHVRVHAHEG
ncbi:hypothetical protein P43SY_000140 [Pythium insidiosum]|uniref:Calcineurin-like phosphoesterase domain-containing protein n=1 Tax=Pythium insidiosum TaxID=114742 RepID=A0AAD5M1X1_PYTIN|nr:hypothetical protein P43SY_000140 [Pythium insidiosum]